MTSATDRIDVGPLMLLAGAVLAGAVGYGLCAEHAARQGPRPAHAATSAGGRPDGPPERPAEDRWPPALRRPDQHRFELPVGEALAAAYYRLDGDRVILTHTEVPGELAGQGIGSRLAEAPSALIERAGARRSRAAPSWPHGRAGTRVADIVVG